MGHVQLVAVGAGRAEAGGAAPEAKHRRAVLRIVADAKEKVAKQAGVDAVVPPGGFGAGKRALPHVAGDLDVLLVVEVEVLKPFRSAGRREMHMEPVRARRAVALPDAGEEGGGRVEGVEERLLVVLGRVVEKVEPQRLAEERPDERGDAGGRCANEGAPPLPGSAAAKHAHGRGRRGGVEPLKLVGGRRTLARGGWVGMKDWSCA